MSSKNSAHIIGNIGADPQVNHANNGNAVVNFSLAQTDNIRNSAGTEEKKTTWFSVTAWGDKALAVEKIVRKGMMLSVVGTLCVDTWEKDGKKQTKTYIRLEDFMICNSKEAI